MEQGITLRQQIATGDANFVKGIPEYSAVNVLFIYLIIARFCITSHEHFCKTNIVFLSLCHSMSYVLVII
jgi:hypothetical protein